MSLDSHSTAYAAIDLKRSLDIAGLNDSTSSAYLRAGMYRDGDPEIQQLKNWPKVIVRIQDSAEYILGETINDDLLIEMHVFTYRDTGFTLQSAVNSQIRAVYDGAAIGQSGDWKFGEMNRLRGFQGPSSGNELHYVHQFNLRALYTPQS